MKVLIVDDHGLVREGLRAILSRSELSAQCLEAWDGASLWMQLDQHPDLELVLLDIQLPGMDGHAVARRLKSDALLKRVPIIAVTSHAMTGDREACRAAGAEGYIEKPINPDSFVAEVERFLGLPPDAERAP